MLGEIRDFFDDRRRNIAHAPRHDNNRNNIDRGQLDDTVAAVDADFGASHETGSVARKENDRALQQGRQRTRTDGTALLGYALPSPRGHPSVRHEKMSVRSGSWNRE